jgi:hypothetical protein
MDPTGTQGAGKGPPRDLDIALEGGPDFFSRLKMIAAAKDEAAQAYARLKIGNDVIAARADAEEQLRRAEEQLRRAEETKAAADEYSERARKEADGYVTVVRQDADKYAARLREETDVAKSHAEEAKQCALIAQAEVKQNSRFGEAHRGKYREAAGTRRQDCEIQKRPAGIATRVRRRRAQTVGAAFHRRRVAGARAGPMIEDSPAIRRPSRPSKWKCGPLSPSWRNRFAGNVM